MAIYHTKEKGSIPEHAVQLSREEVLIYHGKVVDGWRPKSETWGTVAIVSAWKLIQLNCRWFLKNGSIVLGIASSASSIFLNIHYRRKLRLGKFGQFSSYLPVVMMPSFISTAFHSMFVQDEILLGGHCIVCTQTKAAAFQVGLGILYPMVLAPLSSLVVSFLFPTKLRHNLNSMNALPVRHQTFHLPTTINHQTTQRSTQALHQIHKAYI